MSELQKTTLSLTTKSDSSNPSEPNPPKPITPRPSKPNTTQQCKTKGKSKSNGKGKRVSKICKLGGNVEKSPHQRISKDKFYENKSHRKSIPSELSSHSKQHPLEHTWVLWYHDGKSDWSLESYKYIWEFSTIEDFWRLYNNLPSISNTFIFLMRKGHPPIWEVPENIKGGSWLFKFPKKVADREWLKISLYLIGETLSDNSEHLIGLSVSPKNYNVVMRVWNKNHQACFNKLKFPPEIARYKPLYKVFQEYQDSEKQEAKTVIVS